MICSECGTYLDNDSIIICPICGAKIKQSIIENIGYSVDSIREGRRSLNTEINIEANKKQGASKPEHYVNTNDGSSNLVLEFKDNDNKLDFDGENNYKYVSPKSSAPFADKIIYDPKELKRRSKNWAYRGIAIFVVFLTLILSTYMFFKRSDIGQLILARRFKADTAQAYWLVGDEFASKGDMVNAIRAYTFADSKDPNNADGLYSLASVYETIDSIDLAEAIYRRIINDISPNRPEIYRALIRLMLAKNKVPEAADMLKLAYENTDVIAFLDQRNEMLPLPPEVSLPGGRYNSEKTVVITSPQAYEIYYLMDDGTGILPQDGILYDGKPIKIPEGAVKLRAVCTSVNLVSDPIEAKYIIIYPSPAAPKANLAPGTYGSAKSVGLRIGDDNKDVTMHYTIDGSIPTLNSPIYDGTPVKLPSGRVTIRAFSVNTRGKASSTMEVGYKIDTKPYLNKPYNQNDLFNGVKLNETNTETFFEQFGKPTSQEEVSYLSLINTSAKRYNYNWGYADFILVSNKWVLARLDMNSKITESPRGIGFGSVEGDVISKYKDMGQEPNLDGTRGLYYNLPDTGRIMNEKGNKYIKYTCSTDNNYIWVIEYYLNNNSEVNHILHYYQP